jgi:hypothetical protein
LSRAHEAKTWSFYKKRKRKKKPGAGGPHEPPPPGGGSAALVPTERCCLPREVDRLCRGGGGRIGGGEEGSGGITVAAGRKSPGADVSAHRGSGRRTFSGASWKDAGWATRGGEAGESVTISCVVGSGVLVAGGDWGGGGAEDVAFARLVDGGAAWDCGCGLRRG